MTAYRTIPQLERCDKRMFGDLILTCQTPIRGVLPKQVIQPIPYTMSVRRSSVDSICAVKTSIMETEKRRASALMDELLIDIYYSVHNGISTDYNSTSGKSHRSSWMEFVNLQEKDIEELLSILSCLRNYIERMGSVLVRQLKRRDALSRQQEVYCDVITKRLHQRVPQVDTEEGMKFTIQPLPGDTGFSQWVAAMKMVAQLPGGIPTEFRRRLWLTLAERHLASRGVKWPEVERTCFSEWSHPADAELGVQIVKDLHRTGCSLFCGEDGQENQALLKRVLLAYARWNKAVGYCQGFNMLAALILQVTEKCEGDALKLMIYLIEGVLPDSYFADSLRGLSVDMAVFRELLRSRLPRLSKHLDLLQNAAKDGSRSYEPPLTNVFTMQWFLTLFCNCLPHSTVLRVWDLILLEGNEILLRTALAIWQVLAERILSVRTADEFYCVMGVLMRELLEFDLIDGNSLIKAMVAIGPLTELKTLREHYLYNINPWGPSSPQIVDKQLKLYSKQSIALDISALKKQYDKLKQRQRQAHIIFSAAISRQPTPTPPVTMNHLLIGKSALVPAKRLGPPKGSIPPARQTPSSTLLWKDTPKQTSSSSSSDTELCDEKSASSDEEDVRTNRCDNLPLDSDTDLMKNDNTCASIEVEDIATSPSQNPLIGTTETPTVGENLMISKSESDDENFDFEQFLADRVKCLKVTEDEQEERINYARRNSVRALQIIQENSMILHRILQCQSRLSPSPPPIHSRDVIGAADNVSDVSGGFSKHSSSDETGIDVTFDSLQLHKEIDTVETLKSPVYGSKYSSILEKSKSLDVKYHALILNKPISETAEELSSDIEKDTSNIIYSREDKLGSSCSTETLNSGTSYDTESNIVTKTDGSNLPILVEEVIRLDEEKSEVNLPMNSDILKISDSENRYQNNISDEIGRQSDRNQLKSQQKLSNEVFKSDELVDGKDIKPNNISGDAYWLDNYEKIPDERLFLPSIDPVCSQSVGLDLSSHLYYKSPEFETSNFVSAAEYIRENHSAFDENSSENDFGVTLSSTSRMTAESNDKDSAISRINFSDFESNTSDTALNVPFADFNKMHTEEDKFVSSPDYTKAGSVARIYPNEFKDGFIEGKYELEKTSPPLWKDYSCTSERVSDEWNFDIGTVSFRESSFRPEIEICKSESGYNEVGDDRCSTEEKVPKIMAPETISVSPEQSPAKSDEYSRKDSISITTDAELGMFVESDLHSPSSRDCPSRSTSPFISDDWYNIERNNKNLGVEVVAVGGSSSSRSPSRQLSLSPASSPAAATSPSKCFNPFPIPLGSRQTKEVPMKLGLYKK